MPICRECRHCVEHWLCDVDTVDENEILAISYIDGESFIKDEHIDRFGWAVGGMMLPRVLRRCTDKNKNGQCHDYEKRAWWKFWG